MAPSNAVIVEAPGPHPSHIQVAKPYLFQQQIDIQLLSIGFNQAREDENRLRGVQWIDEVRKALELPIRTFCTAVVYYHKFRLVHKDTEYQYQDAAAAALLTACKIEDTLKKSKDILCASHNMKVPPSEHLSADDISFEGPSKIVIGLERLMLEASGFDFRVRYPHKYLCKIGKFLGLEQPVILLGFDILTDLYRTFGPLKQTTSTMSYAPLKLATMLMDTQEDFITLARYKEHKTGEEEVLETIHDLLDLYTHNQNRTIVGPRYEMKKFIAVRLKCRDDSKPRHTCWYESSKTNGIKSNVKTPKTPITPASPSDTRTNGKDGVSPATMSPHSSASSRRGMGARGQDGTVRFMLDAEQAKEEKAVVDKFFNIEMEEYEVEIEEPIVKQPQNHHHRNGGHGHGRDFHNKRMRR